MALSEVLYDLILAPYRIARMQKNSKVAFLLKIVQIPYFVIPGVFLLLAILIYLVLIQVGHAFLSLIDLLINSKKYKYLEENGYTEDYLRIKSPLTEI
jgi:hypothetical protein